MKLPEIICFFLESKEKKVASLTVLSYNDYLDILDNFPEALAFVLIFIYSFFFYIFISESHAKRTQAKCERGHQPLGHS